MSIIQGNAKQGSTRGFYNFPLEQSLRFNDDDSAYLSWTPASAGNEQTWTLSMWFKRCTFGVNHKLFDAFVDDTNRTFVQFHTDDKLTFFSRESGTNNLSLQTSQVFRDPSAWYHLVVVADFSNATQTERGKVYINGTQVTSFSSTTYPASTSINTMVNNTSAEHKLGANDDSTGVEGFFDGYLAEVNFIDGQALDADSFGELKSGVWIPKDPSGLTYGTNGFRLSFADDAEVEAFNTVLWRGNGVSGTGITGMGFQPDLVWLKSRSTTWNHTLQDSVRGVSNYLISNLTAAEASSNPRLSSFDSDGFTLTDNGNSNENGQTYVAWGWKAGDSNVSNTDGDITSTVRANDTYGFSIVSYTGNGTADQTVGHGLTTAPSFGIIKDRDTNSNNNQWQIFHTGAGDDYGSFTTDAFTGTAGAYPTTGDATTITIGRTGNNVLNTNESGDRYIAYIWAEKAGYSKFGSYEGNGSADGPEITTGFKPAWILVKGASGAGNWHCLDTTRDTSNPMDSYLNLNSSAAEGSVVFFDALSDGFKIKNTSTGWNGSGETYIYAAFADTREAAFWLDQSGNDNDWQPVNLDHNDTVADSPTDNFATLNPTAKAIDTGSLPYGKLELSNGNLALNGEYGNVIATIGVTSGKWYWEVEAGEGIMAGVSDRAVVTTSSNVPGTYSRSAVWNVYYADTVVNTGYTVGSPSLSAASTSGDIVGVALDMDAGEVRFYKNGTVQNSGNAVITGVTGTAFPVFRGARSGVRNVNFGQLGFTYTPPTDYLALSTANLPEPTISPADDASPSDYFNTVLYPGTGAAQSITGVGFQPDFLWLKSRSITASHILVDAVRSPSQELSSNTTTVETTNSGRVDSLDADGWSFGATTAASLNQASATYVAWNWKANGSGVSNTVGSIPSQVSANTTSGFSIVSYTATSVNGTIGHGLTQAPELVICRNRDGSDSWAVGSDYMTSWAYSMELDTTDAEASVESRFNSTAPTTSVFSVGTSGFTNSSAGDEFIAYCFHSVEGFSKLGSYTGNGSADGPFVYTGFRPAFVMVKRTDSTGSWQMKDTARNASNLADLTLFANLSNAEYSTFYFYDVLSNGFKVRGTDAELNASGGTYIYMAFAENPFKYSNAR